MAVTLLWRMDLEMNIWPNSGQCGMKSSMENLGEFHQHMKRCSPFFSQILVYSQQWESSQLGRDVFDLWVRCSQSRKHPWEEAGNICWRALGASVVLVPKESERGCFCGHGCGTVTAKNLDSRWPRAGVLENTIGRCHSRNGVAPFQSRFCWNDTLCGNSETSHSLFNHNHVFEL